MWQMVIVGISILILLSLSAVFSFSEMALATVNKIKVQKLADSNENKRRNKKARTALVLINNYNETITSIVIMNNIVNILGTTLATVWFSVIMPDPAIAAIVSFVVMTLATIIFGELTPKMLAKKHSLEGSLLLSSTVKWTVIIFKPLTWFIGLFIKDKEEVLLESDEDIKHALLETHKAGHINETEAELLHRALDIDEISVNKIMIPLDEIISIKKNIKLSKLKSIVIENGYTRYPVVNNEGEVVGIFNANFFLKDQVQDKKFKIENTMFDVDFFTKQTKLDVILHQLKANRQHMGIVVSKQGSKKMIGVITIEDIIEELFGELYDETDRAEDGILDINEEHFIIHWDALATDVVKEVYNSKKKIDETITFSDFLMKHFKVKELKDGDNFIYKNSMIWIRKDKRTSRSSLSIEIDIFK